MKKISFILFLCLQILITKAQSPYLSVHLSMDSAESKYTNYKIVMKFCDLKKESVIDNWFTHDSSTITFNKLLPADLNCKDYIEPDGSKEDPSRSKSTFNKYDFGNQVFAFEKVLVFKISNYSSRGLMPDMYVVLPVKYKSFVTSIELTNVSFQSGKVIYIEKALPIQDSAKLIISLSLKDVVGTEENDFFLKEIL
ncbi:MAG: hypothetical protein V4556_13665 [Bacteroidota bacterium]